MCAVPLDFDRFRPSTGLRSSIERAPAAPLADFSSLSALAVLSFSHRTLPTDGGFVPWFAVATAWRMAANQWVVERLSVTINSAKLYDLLASRTG
jgi:hypothetical protein